MNLDDTNPKPASLSLGVMGAITALAGLLGFVVTQSDLAAAVDLTERAVVAVTSLGTVVTGLLAIWGRIRATRKIG